MIKKISVVLLITIVSLISISYANVIMYKAPIFNIEIHNIDEGIKSVWVCVYDESDIKIEEVFKDSNLEFLDRNPSSKIDLYKRYSKDGNAIIHRTPRHSGDVLEYVDDYLEVKEDADFNLTYNKKDYIVDVYNASGGSTWYTPKKLIELYEVPTSKIDNNKLSILISDTSVLNEYLKKDLNSGLAVRFEDKNDDYKTVIVGNNIVEQGHAKNFRPESSRIIKNVEVDYISGKITSTSNIDMLIDEKINTTNTKNLIIIFFAILGVILLELIIFKLLNKTKYLKTVLIITIIIGIVVLSFYHMVFRSIVTLV